MPNANGAKEVKKAAARVKRFKWSGDPLQKVFSPHLAQALLFHDDTLLPAPSHAFFDPATGAPKPNDGRPVHAGLRPDFDMPNGA